MNKLLSKLQFKDEDIILVLDPPAEFEHHIIDFNNHSKVITDPGMLDRQALFVLAFVRNIAEIERVLEYIPEKPGKNFKLWFCYPKKTSSRYKTDLSRDNGWEILGELSFEPVRMVAIDEDWSALRFRHIESIRVFKRKPDLALSERGWKRNS